VQIGITALADAPALKNSRSIIAIIAVYLIVCFMVFPPHERDGACVCIDEEKECSLEKEFEETILY